MKLSSQNTSTSIYLQQIQNQIDLAVGYAKIRPYLFKQLLTADGSNALSDDKLPQLIITKLTANLNENLHQCQKIDRAIKIIEDILTHAEEVMTPAMHNEYFISALVTVALPKIITFNSKLEEYSRVRVLGLFMFWYQTYAREEKGDYNLFFTAHKMLKDRKLTFPDYHTIKPNDALKKQMLAQKTPVDHTTQVILDDIQQFTKKTEILMKQNIKAIVNTEYVRLIKHKSKVLFEFTQKGSTLNDKQKNLVKELYKKLRNVLKQVQKINQNKLQTKNSIKQEQAYVQQKMTPKKKEQPNELPPENIKQLSSKKEKEPQNVETAVPDLKLNKPFSKHLSAEQRQKEAQINTIDLLDMATPTKQKPDASQKKVANSSKKVEPQTDFLDLLGEKVQKKGGEVNDQEQFVEGTFVQNQNLIRVPSKKQQQQQINKALFEVFSTPKKSDKDNKQDEENVLVKNSSKKSQAQSVQVQNEQNKKNKYSFIPNDLDLTPTSSQEDVQTPKKNGFGFNIFGLFGANKQNQKSQDLYDQTKPYDYIPQYLKNKVQSQSQKRSELQTQNSQKLQATNFYALKPVKPVEYLQKLERSPTSEHDEQDRFHAKVEFQNLQQVALQSAEAKDKEGKQLIQDQD